jgi:hypothetical protein
MYKVNLNVGNNS